jgi:D-3-phosphoglycerate dehydrogenase
MAGARVLLTDNADRSAKDILEGAGFDVDVSPTMAPEELKKAITEYDAIVVRSATKLTGDILQNAQRLKIVGRAGAGVDNIDMEAAKERRIAVVNSPAGNVNAVAEHAIALMLALSRNIHRAHAHVKEGGWEKKLFSGVELRGKCLGVIGLGKIGRLVSAAAKGLGMEVAGYDPYVAEESATSLGIKSASLNELLSSSDFITVHVPLTEGTRSLIGESEFSMMKDGVRILNVARGGIISENALYDAIKSGKVAGAALDVWENEPPNGSKLLGLEEVLATPHLGGSTSEAQVNVAADVARNITMFLTEGKAEPRCRVA